MNNRRDFLRSSGTAALMSTLASGCTSGVGRRAGNSAAMLIDNPDHPEPARVDRLPLEWHHATVKKSLLLYMTYPNRDHGLRAGKGTSLHLRTLMARYLINHLPPGPK